MKHLRIELVVSLFSLVSVVVPTTQTHAADRQVIRIDTGWKFQREGATAGPWKSVTVPSSMQEHEGNDFHGVGIYRGRTPKVLPSSRTSAYFCNSMRWRLMRQSDGMGRKWRSTWVDGPHSVWM